MQGSGFEPSFGRITLLCLLFCLFPIFVTASESAGSTDEIHLYVVIPAPDDLSGYGKEAETAVLQAVDDMNSGYRDIGSHNNVILNLTYISSDPESALAAVQKIHESDAHMVIAYLTSSQLAAVKSYVDANDILILCSGSSATSLSIPGDNIIRFNPNDSIQDYAIKYMLDQANITRIVPLVRDDLWDNFSNITSVRNKMMDSNLDDIIRYDADTAEFKEILEKLDRQVGQVLETEDKDTVGVLTFSYSEIVPILEEASSVQYQNLSMIRWFGTNMQPLNPDLLNSQIALDFSSDRTFTGFTITSALLNPYPQVCEQITKKLGYEPNGLVYGLYDSARIGVEALSLHGADDAISLRKAVTQISMPYYGILGFTKLNEAGDRVCANYALLTIEKDSEGKGVWKKLGTVAKLNENSLPLFSIMKNGQRSYDSFG